LRICRQQSGSFTMKFQHFIFIALLLAGCAAPRQSEADRSALETGNAILAVDEALQYQLPDNPTPAEIAKADKLTGEMVRAGQITRLYPWVSARIELEISTTEHLLKDTHPDEIRTRQLNQRLKYLRRVKLLMDAPL
jgi:hypothetical protein